MLRILLHCNAILERYQIQKEGWLGEVGGLVELEGGGWGDR